MPPPECDHFEQPARPSPSSRPATHLRHHAVHIPAVRGIGGAKVLGAGHGGPQLAKAGPHHIHGQVESHVGDKVVLLLALGTQRGAQAGGQPRRAVVLGLAVVQGLRGPGRGHGREEEAA